MAQLSAALGVRAQDTEQSVEEEFFQSSHIPMSEWRAVAAALMESTKPSDHDQGRLFDELHGISGKDRLAKLISIFCTNEYKPRARIVTKAIAEENPDLAERLKAEQGRICALLDKLSAVRCRDRTGALITIVTAVIARYRDEKGRRGLLDYDDLIDKTLALFRKTSAAWVLYKLDLGVDHILIDEAQDTSPKQWEIIRTLVDEFTAGAGAREVKRTFFAVGDDKQSIFSFQGAEPERFDDVQRDFKRAFDAVELEWRPVKLQTSFRSGEIVLGAVDEVFRAKEIFASVTSDEAGIPPHIALEDAAPGQVEIWPLTLPDEKPSPAGWDAPFDTRSETSATVRLARRIASNVKLWCEAGTKPGDVLVLVRQRGALFEGVIRALKAERIPVAGADRLVLTEHIAVMDLMALGDALLLPQDDLALASALKSPLFGFTDEDLYEIAYNRAALTLLESLLAKAAGNPRFAAAAAKIEHLTDAARGESPFTFYARLLSLDHGRKRILARLGHEAADALDEFLNLALAYEKREAASLQGFLAWLRAAQAEVKRDMEVTRAEVRVMTVHGAKGLEAPIVVLADTTTRPQGNYPPRLLSAPLQGCDGLIWTGRKNQDAPFAAQARAAHEGAAADEYRRLLYVAMTRAERKLVICGTASRVTKDGKEVIPDGCWYQLITQALVERAGDVTAREKADDGTGDVWRYRKLPEEAPAIEKSATIFAPAAPGWLDQDVVRDPPRAKVVTPSSGDEEIAAVPTDAAFDRQTALTRGRLVHRLMQSLPDIPVQHRENAARHYLDRAGKMLDQAARDEIAAQVMTILNDLKFAPLFDPGSRAEVPVVGRLSDRSHPDIVVSGQIDRLAVTKDEIMIADYKTNRPAPRTIDELLARHGGYVRQLALYRAVLSQIYPGRPVKAALVWTDLPDLMEIPARLLDERIADLTPA
jgi:ATP-dependent helicase/nuclease subunit A